jgi:signal transduction histidine kinase
MQRLYIRILVALVATVALSFFAFTGAFFRMTQPGVGRLVQTVQAVLLDEALAALRASGPVGAGEALRSRERISGGQHYLTDAAGRDVVTGEDRSALLAWGPPRPSRAGGPALVYRSTDGQYALITLAPAPFGPWDLWPYYAVLVTAVAGVCWILALDIARPLRRMSKMLDAFGRGHLRARTGFIRSDEVGALAQSIDAMADRIETLVSAERRLLQDVSHELRSPITRLKVALELSRTMEDRDAAAAFLQRDVDRLSFLVSALLEVTRLEGEARLASTQDVNLTDLLSDISADVELEARERQVRVAVPPGAAHVAGDRELLRRAFENVIRNAIRHAPKATTVELDIEASPASLKVVVRDYGPGVPADVLAQLGTPFFRVDEAREASTGGFGLGLSIARRAIQLHGGQWRIENAHPGLRVTMVIPQRQAIAVPSVAALRSFDARP